MATDPAALAAVLDLEDQAGSMADVGPGEIAVGTRYAEDHGLQLGDTVPVTFVDGTTHATSTVADIFGREDVMSNLIMHKADWTPHAGGQDADVVVFVDARRRRHRGRRPGRRRRRHRRPTARRTR